MSFIDITSDKTVVRNQLAGTAITQLLLFWLFLFPNNAHILRRDNKKLTKNLELSKLVRTFATTTKKIVTKKCVIWSPPLNSAHTQKNCVLSVEVPIRLVVVEGKAVGGAEVGEDSQNVCLFTGR